MQDPVSGLMSRPAGLCRFSCIDLNARGPGCFDTEFYNTENVDLHDKAMEGQGFDAGQAYHHFLHNGQFEGRHYRCWIYC